MLSKNMKSVNVKESPNKTNINESVMSFIHEMQVFLNCKINGHLIEDAKILVEYEMFPSEPDVGIFHPTVEISDIKSIKDRPIKRIFKALSQKDLNSIADSIYEKHFN